MIHRSRSGQYTREIALAREQAIDRQRSRAAEHQRDGHQKKREGILDAAALARTLGEKKAVAPVAQKQCEGDKTRQAERRGPHKKAQSERHDGEQLDHQGEHAEGNRNMIFVPPVGDLRFRPLAAVPAERVLRPVHKKSQR
jgi:hypothetical protein